MKTIALILGVLLLTQVGCSTSFTTEESSQDKALIINNHQLDGRDVKIGDTVVIEYNSNNIRYLDDCIADMESRGYIVKQVQEKQGIFIKNMFIDKITVVVYERSK